MRQRDDATRALPDRRLVILGVAALLATAAGVAVIALAMGPERPGRREAVAFAAAICLPGALAAWLLSRLPVSNPALAVATPLAGIALRIMPPLVALAWLSTQKNQPEAPGTAPILVAMYLALLATDILLHILVRGPAEADKNQPH